MRYIRGGKDVKRGAIGNADVLIHTKGACRCSGKP